MDHIKFKSARALTSAGVGCALALVLMGARSFAPALAELASFRIGNFSLSTGQSALGIATLTSLSKLGTPIVSFSSSNTGVATVPLSRPVSATGVATVPVRGVAPGCARITASFGARTRVDDIVVHSLASASFSASVPDRFVIVGETVDGTINKPSTTTTAPDGSLRIQRASFSLVSSNPAVATVPASVPQTSKATTFHIRATGEGCAVISISTGTETLQKALQVIRIPG